MTDTIKIRRALLSVSDKQDLETFASGLSGHGAELVSTGGTARAIKDAGLPVRDVADLTGFPEMMDGRVKTLHPGVHGGILADRNKPAHMEAMEKAGIGAIDLVCVNLYPFERTVAGGADYATAIENIDIGGPAMIRAAAKNHSGVVIVVDPQDYAAILEELGEKGGVSAETARCLAHKAFARTAAYDAAISNWFAAYREDETPDFRALGGARAQSLRYGENPHQAAAFYRAGLAREGVSTARQLQGKELSYNNINDTDAAFELVAEFDPAERAAVAIIKHANPCGVAVGDDLVSAYRAAYDCDRTSAFGGIVALNRPLDADAARAITEIFTEVIIAPGASDEAAAIVAEKKNLRLLVTGGLPDPAEPGLSLKTVAGGFLSQGRDNGCIAPDQLRIVTKREPDARELADMLFAWRVAKHVKSNAIVYALNGATAGIGAGQMSRVDSSRIAARKALDAAEAAGWDGPCTKGSAVASDAFFPFADGLLSAVEAGATAVIQPGGSMRDDDVIAAANEHGLAMAFTGMRHFRH
ncbi:bifunctional phosphoribosylaminoimidazolecarboxamide formyltransferase/IMP cyclohydrolase [Tepidamorphus sp. 3E244]|uniref:bifunctional phosphoribosylaminoimidazolecarboxamide formyltransferase/IMP cyclohydrolase n=1 Tax=Tepidamorphus sp. 3E244 TaxID=3385498 RepID=UPI0038FC004C